AAAGLVQQFLDPAGDVRRRPDLDHPVHHVRHPKTRAPTSCHPSLRDIPYTASHLARSVVMGIARIPIVRGPVPVVQQGQEASSGPVGLILTRQGIPVLEGTSSEGVAKGTKSALSPATITGRREVGQSEL